MTFPSVLATPCYAFGFLKTKYMKKSETKIVLNEVLNELIVKNHSILVPNDENQRFYEGKIKGLEEASKIVKQKIKQLDNE